MRENQADKQHHCKASLPAYLPHQLLGCLLDSWDCLLTASLSVGNWMYIFCMVRTFALFWPFCLFLFLFVFIILVGLIDLWLLKMIGILLCVGKVQSQDLARWLPLCLQQVVMATKWLDWIPPFCLSFCQTCRGTSTNCAVTFCSHGVNKTAVR